MPTEQSILPASLWAASACPAPVCQPFVGGRRTTVAIVGAGYTGLSAALHLARDGHDVTVLEASEPGWGASGRNGGQITSGLKFEPDMLENLLGAERGPRLVDAMGNGGQLVRSLIEKYNITCHASFNGWIQAAHGQKSLANIVKPRVDQWRKRNVAAEFLSKSQVSEKIGAPFGLYVGGWNDPRGGLLQPLSYARGLAAAALSEGAVIHNHAPVRRLSRSGNGWVLDIGSETLSADKVLLATNAYTDNLWPSLKKTVVPVSSFQIATYPLDPAIGDTILPGGQGVTDTRRLLLYFRKDPMGRVLMGGRCPIDDYPTMKEAKQLRASLVRTFPQLNSAPIQFVWSGKVALTKDSLPHIHNPASGLYCALGCNGRGVATATVLGKIAASLVGGSAPDELPLPVTVPDSYPLHTFRRLGVIGMSHYYRIMDIIDGK